MDKLLSKVEAVRRKYRGEPAKLLVILTARREADRELQEKAGKSGVEFITGKIVEEKPYRTVQLLKLSTPCAPAGLSSGLAIPRTHSR